MHKNESADPRAGYRWGRMRWLTPVFVLAAWLVPAATAFAGDNGEGLWGETDDKIITFFSLGVVIFFAVFVALASWLQAALDRRKEQRKAVELRKRVGW
jgi:hypothetical protein